MALIPNQLNLFDELLPYKYIGAYPLYPYDRGEFYVSR